MNDPQRNRRKYLKAVGIMGITGLTGCLSRGKYNPSDPTASPLETKGPADTLEPTEENVSGTDDPEAAMDNVSNREEPTQSKSNTDPSKSCEGVEWSEVTRGNYPLIDLKNAPGLYDESGSANGDEARDIYHTHALEYENIKAEIAEYNETQDPTTLYTTQLEETLEKTPDKDRIGLKVTTLGKRTLVQTGSRDIHGFTPTECEIETLAKAGEIGYIPEFGSTEVSLSEVQQEDVSRIAALPFVIRVNYYPEAKNNMVTNHTTYGDRIIQGDEYDLKQFAFSTGNPVSSDGSLINGRIRLFESAESALEWLPFEAVHETQRSEQKAFVANTNFQPEVLLYIELAGPHSGTREIAIEELSIDPETVTGTVRVKHISDGGAEAITYSAALVRIHGTATQVTLAAINGWNKTTELHTEIG